MLCSKFLSSANRSSARLVARALISNQSQLSRPPASLALCLVLPESTPLSVRYKSTSGQGQSVDDDHDLDAAIDSILSHDTQSQQVLSEISKRWPLQEVENDRASPRISKNDPVDFRDAEILNTNNPRWIKAGLSPDVINVLSEKGITHLTPVQAEAFAPILAGRDVIGRSRTGTGKTLAFGMPALTRLLELAEAKGTRIEGRMKRGRNVSMLVLCPTRELAKQVQEELALIARPLGLFTTVFHGGVSYDPQMRALEQGIDVLVGTPGRVIDHIQRGALTLSECDTIVLDEADEMLNMGFAQDVEVILNGLGSSNKEKSQCLLFSATTPPWVKQIGKKYQKNVLAIDSTGEEGGARVATTVRHLAVQLPPGFDAKKAVLEDIIAVEISKDSNSAGVANADLAAENPIAAAAKAKKDKSANAIQQKIFGKTMVFTQTKKEADELVSSGVFKSLTAQAIHGDISQKQRETILDGFRGGAFNVLVATDVAARGIDIRDVDLVVQLDPPRDVDSYVHRSGRTGRAGRNGVSVLLFNPSQARDIVQIERDLGHDFKFDLVGPPSAEAALRAAAKTSANACMVIPDETAAYFKDAAISLLENGENSPEDIIARCLAAISKRTTAVESRSLLTGEVGMATVEMSYIDSGKHRITDPKDVMFTVGKLSRMSQRVEGLTFDAAIGKIFAEDTTALFDMDVEDANKLVEFCKTIDAGGAAFTIKHEIEVKRGRHFGRSERNFSDNSRNRRDFGNSRNSRRSLSPSYDRYGRGNRRDSVNPRDRNRGEYGARENNSWRDSGRREDNSWRDDRTNMGGNRRGKHENDWKRNSNQGHRR